MKILLSTGTALLSSFFSFFLFIFNIVCFAERKNSSNNVSLFKQNDVQVYFHVGTTTNVTECGWKVVYNYVSSSKRQTKYSLCMRQMLLYNLCIFEIRFSATSNSLNLITNKNKNVNACEPIKQRSIRQNAITVTFWTIFGHEASLRDGIISIDRVGDCRAVKTKNTKKFWMKNGKYVIPLITSIFRFQS